MNCTVNRTPRVVTTAPDFNNVINQFFNTAVGDVVQKTDKKRRTNPAVNVREYVDKIELQIAVPGLSKEQVTITIDNDLLKVEALDSDQKNATYRLREFNYEGFTKNFRLPESIDPNSINARFESGILTLTLDKKKEAIPQPPRKIEIQ